MPEDGRTQREETAGEMEVTSPADMYAEGMEEIDGSFYSMSMRDIIVFRGSF